MIDVRVLDETHLIYEGRVDFVHFEGAEGEFDLAENHAPILSLLKKGTIVVAEIASSSTSGGLLAMTARQGSTVPRGTVKSAVIARAEGPKQSRTLQISIERGIVKMERNNVLALVELRE